MMDKLTLQTKIESILRQMGYTRIESTNGDTDNLRVYFDGNFLVSFREQIPGWGHSGIQKDDTGVHQYMILFRKK